MTQQPYYPPQYPQAPQQPVQQPYPQQYAQPVAQQPFPGMQAPPPAQPSVPLANGTLDDYYNQPNTGGGANISWTANGFPKPEGTSYAGIVARDVTNGDIQQQTDPKTQQPKFYRDGRPMFVMKVPLRVQPSQDFPDGEAVLWVRGQMREELVRAMSEAGVTGAPRGGDALQVTLVQRKPSRGGGNPQNVFAINYTPASAAGTGAPSPAPVPAAQPPVQQVAQAPQQVAPQQPVQQYQQAPPAQQYAPAPVQQQVPAPQAQQVPQQPVAPQAPAQPAVPDGFAPEQQQLLARIQGQQAS